MKESSGMTQDESKSFFMAVTNTHFFIGGIITRHGLIYDLTLPSLTHTFSVISVLLLGHHNL